MKTFIIVGSFQKEEEFGTDPYSYYIELDKVSIKRYGDDYHDDGHAKCHAWIEGFTAGKGITEWEIEYEERADCDDEGFVDLKYDQK